MIDRDDAEGVTNDKLADLPKSDWDGPVESELAADFARSAVGTDMTESREAFNARLAVERIRRDLEKARPFADGTVLRFTSVGVDGRRWAYAAIFGGGYWHLTGDNSYFARKYEHTSLMSKLLADGYRITDVAIASAWAPIEL